MYILIIVVTFGASGAAVTTQEFGSELNCLSAKQWVLSPLLNTRYSQTVVATCTPK